MFFSILKTVFIIFEVLCIFNLIIIVHELGHFLAARWRGLVIEEFGVWFGKPLWRKKFGDVYYSLGSIPAGGFVKLPQLADMSAIEGDAETPQVVLPKISPLDKIIVAFAGPLFSFGLAVLFAVIVWQIGRPVGEAEATTTIGYVMEDSPAEKAGLMVGDKILAVDGVAVKRFMGMSDDAITWRIVRSEGTTIPVQVERIVNGRPEKLIKYPKPEIPENSVFARKGLRQIEIAPASTPMIAKVEPGSAAEKAGYRANDLITEVNGVRLLSIMGIDDYIKDHPHDEITLTVKRAGQTMTLPYSTRGATIGDVMKDSPAAQAGLAKGDLITAIDGQAVPNALWATDYIRAQKEKALSFALLRGNETRELKVTPQVPVSGLEDVEKRPMIGVGWKNTDGIAWDDSGVQHVIYPKPTEQIRQAVMSIVNTVSGLLSAKSDLSIQHLSGPVMIGRLYYHMFENPDGWRMALWFSVIFNVNLALLNMLPIPVLDGGHITLALVEAIRRKPINVRLVEGIQTACVMLVFGFMIFITYFDVSDLLGIGKREAIKFATPAERVK